MSRVIFGRTADDGFDALADCRIAPDNVRVFFIWRKTLQYILHRAARPVRPLCSRYVKLHALLAAVAIGQPSRCPPVFLTQRFGRFARHDSRRLIIYRSAVVSINSYGDIWHVYPSCPKIRNARCTPERSREFTSRPGAVPRFDTPNLTESDRYGKTWSKVVRKKGKGNKATFGENSYSVIYWKS